MHYTYFTKEKCLKKEISEKLPVSHKASIHCFSEGSILFDYTIKTVGMISGYLFFVLTICFLTRFLISFSKNE